jgi:hypothetical protein
MGWSEENHEPRDLEACAEPKRARRQVSAQTSQTAQDEEEQGQPQCQGKQGVHPRQVEVWTRAEVRRSSRDPKAKTLGQQLDEAVREEGKFRQSRKFHQ